MDLYYTLFVIQTALIYSGICMYSDQNQESFLQADDGDLTLPMIDVVQFTVQWNHSAFDGDTFTVNAGDCNKEVTCNTTECTFDSVKDGDCRNFVGCQDVTVTVTDGTTTKQIQFNLAPYFVISPKVSLAANIATITWDAPNAVDPNDDISCATRARATVQIGGGDLIDGLPEDVSLVDANILELTLPECEHGTLTAQVIYLSKSGDYDTERKANAIGDTDYKGVGITTVTVEESDQSCSLDASWEVACDYDSNRYTVTWDDGEMEGGIIGKTYTIPNLNVGDYTVSVQAYWSDDSEMGDVQTAGNSMTIAEIAPDAPSVTADDGSDRGPKKLSVSWTPPTPDTCTGVITGYTVTCGDSPSEDVGADASTYEVTCAEACTEYDVTVAAKWDEGTGNPDTTSGTSGSGAPGKPSITKESVATDNIEVTWAPSDEANSCPVTKYTVNWTPDDGDADGDAGTDLTYTITGLTCNTDYTINVTATAKDDKTSMSDESVITTQDQVPKEVQNVNANEVSDDPTNLVVTWSEANASVYDCGGGLTGYLITWEIDGDTLSNTAGPSDVSYTIPGLEPCTDYTVNVAAISQTELTGPDTTVTGTTGIQAPAGPVLSIETASSTTSSLSVSWTQNMINNCDITKYEVKWSPETGDGDDNSIDVGGTEKSYTIPDLICNTGYTVTVTAYTSEDKFKESSTETGTTKDEAPGQPTVELVVMEDPTQLNVTWDAPEYNCTGELGQYRVTWIAEGGELKTKLVDDTFFTIAGLEPCTTYTVSVAAKSNTGTPGKQGENNETTAVEAPAEPVLSIEDNSNTPTSIFAKWTQPTINNCDITKYEVKWSPETGDGDGDSTDVGGTERSYTIPDLICNTAYTVTVTAYTSKDKSKESSTETGTTEDQAPEQTTVDKVLAPEEYPTQLIASWSETAYACNGSELGEYNVTWTADGDDNPTGTRDVADTTFTIDYLVPCTTYTVSVAARSSTGKLGPSGTYDATTAVEVPGQSTDVKCKTSTPHSLEVDWEAPSINPCTITEYTVQWISSNGGELLEETVSKPPYNITDLSACTDYNITVIAYTAKGAGQASEPVTLTSGTDAPPIDAINITPQSRIAHVSWERPVTDCELEYDVDYNGTTLWTNNQTIDSGKTPDLGDTQVETDLKNLLPYSNYNVCVTVKTGPKTCNTFITDKEVPSAPRDVAVKDGSVTDVSLTLLWQFPVEENGILEDYVVYWSRGSESSTNATVKATDTSYNITGLTEGNYSITVKVSNIEGFSDQSKPIYCHIDGSSPPPCGGGCIAGIVVGVLVLAGIVVVMAVPVTRHKIMNTITPNKRSPATPMESPYELKEAAILKKEFRSHVEMMESDGGTYAYQMLNDESPQKNKFAASKPFNKGKNRYANIHPFDDTRVKLPLIKDGPKGSDYINANHVTFPGASPLEFIASQGPLENTVGDFWRMIWEHNVYDVVMLCNLTENGKSKCAQYWTDSGERPTEIGEFKVYCQAEEEDRRNQCITRYIDIVKNGQHRLVKQHHYIAWPDHGVPQNEDDMLNFLASVKGKSNPHGKNTVVHCSAGVGRTGTFIGLWVLTNILNEERSAKSINVHRIAVMMRECRCDMVQTKGQYLYLHKCLLKYMNNLDHYQRSSRHEVDDEPIYGNSDMIKTGITNKAYQVGNEGKHPAVTMKHKNDSYNS